MTGHVCDERCTCPVHGTPMYYANTTDLHACQDPSCAYAHGVDIVALVVADLNRANAERRQRHPELWYGNWPAPEPAPGA